MQSEKQFAHRFSLEAGIAAGKLISIGSSRTTQTSSLSLKASTTPGKGVLQMPNRALSTTSKPLASSGEIARQWLVKFSEICQKDLSQALVQIWMEQLRDIAPDLLNQACDRLAKTWTSGFLPTPGNVRAQIDQANAKGFGLEAGEAWQFSLNYCMRHYHPDIGVSRRAPELPVACDHAIRAAGGMSFIFNCSREDLVWAKKRFVEDYTTIHETRQVEHLLSKGDARKIIDRLTGNLQEQRKLPKAQESQLPEQPLTDAEIEEATENAWRKICEAPVQTKNEPDYAAELRRQKEALVARGYLPSEQGNNRAR